MQASVVSIQSKSIRPHLPYVLFNRGTGSVKQVVAYPNTNICVGIIRRGRLQSKSGMFEGRATPEELFVYSTGLYGNPHRFSIDTQWDEICLDFTPLGYFHFFDVPSQPHNIEDNLLHDLFSSNEIENLHIIFEQSSSIERARLLEQLLLPKIRPTKKTLLEHFIYRFHREWRTVQLDQLCEEMACSHQTMNRHFKDHFSISAKEYLQIIRIRHAINQLVNPDSQCLTQVAYECGFYDQSHFIREMKRRCHLSPSQARKSMSAVDSKVVVSLNEPC